MAQQQNDNPQLTLAITVNPFQSWLISTKKTLRHFKYSPLIQLLRHFLFWVHLGLVGSVVFLRFVYFSKLQQSFAVLNQAAATVPGFVGRSVRSLAEVDQILLLMLFVMFLSWLVSFCFYLFGKQGVVTYVLICALLLIMLLAKVIISPILLLGIW